MKISDIKIYTMDAFRTNWAFIKVETDEGLYGWGEATLGTQEMALEGCVNDFKRLIVGRDAHEIERLLFEVYRDCYWKGGPVMMSALSGIEIALWDIKGKFYNTPVYNLLGGKMRDRVKMYANAWFVNARTPEDFASAAKKVKALGIQALKWDPFGKAHMTLSRAEMDRAVAIVGAVREAVGPEMEILIECHGRFNHYTAVEASRELAPFKPMFFEEPVPPDNLDALRAVHDRSPVAIAAGERLYTRWDYRKLFDLMAVDYIQPDVSHAGGIMELKKIAAEAECRCLPFAPHNPSGPVANAATLQLAACCPNFCILEIMYNDVEWRKDVTNESLTYEIGYLMIPDNPGLGIEIDEEACLAHPYKPHTLRHYSGALTDIRPAKTEFYF